jgi:hypothetical protein
MKLLTKFGMAAVLAGVLAAGTTLYVKAAPGGGPMSTEETIVKEHSLLDQMQSDSRHIHHLQAIARKEKDIIKLNCVNDKLVQVKPQLNIADRARLDIEVATNDGTRGSAFEVLAQSAEAVRKLREDADACIGEPILGTESANSFTGPQPPDYPYGNPFGPGVEPPGYASPYN